MAVISYFAARPLTITSVEISWELDGAQLGNTPIIAVVYRSAQYAAAYWPVWAAFDGYIGQFVDVVPYDVIYSNLRYMLKVINRNNGDVIETKEVSLDNPDVYTKLMRRHLKKYSEMTTKSAYFLFKRSFNYHHCLRCSTENNDTASDSHCPICLGTGKGETIIFKTSLDCAYEYQNPTLTLYIPALKRGWENIKFKRNNSYLEHVVLKPGMFQVTVPNWDGDVNSISFEPEMFRYDTVVSIPSDIDKPLILSLPFTIQTISVWDSNGEVQQTNNYSINKNIFILENYQAFRGKRLRIIANIKLGLDGANTMVFTSSGVEAKLGGFGVFADNLPDAVKNVFELLIKNERIKLVLPGGINMMNKYFEFEITDTNMLLADKKVLLPHNSIKITQLEHDSIYLTAAATGPYTGPFRLYGLRTTPPQLNITRVEGSSTFAGNAYFIFDAGLILRPGDVIIHKTDRNLVFTVQESIINTFRGNPATQHVRAVLVEPGNVINNLATKV